MILIVIALMTDGLGQASCQMSSIQIGFVNAVSGKPNKTNRTYLDIMRSLNLVLYYCWAGSTNGAVSTGGAICDLVTSLPIPDPRLRMV